MFARTHQTSKFAHPFTSTRAAVLTGRGGYVTIKGHVHERGTQNAQRGALKSHGLPPPRRTPIACDLGVTYLKGVRACTLSRGAAPLGVERVLPELTARSAYSHNPSGSLQHAIWRDGGRPAVAGNGRGRLPIAATAFTAAALADAAGA